MKGKVRLRHTINFIKLIANIKFQKKSVNYLYEKFKSQKRSLEDKKETSPKIKFTDERLIELAK
jgi:hypothetical protein